MRELRKSVCNIYIYLFFYQDYKMTIEIHHYYVNLLELIYTCADKFMSLNTILLLYIYVNTS